MNDTKKIIITDAATGSIIISRTFEYIYRSEEDAIEDTLCALCTKYNLSRSDISWMLFKGPIYFD